MGGWWIWVKLLKSSFFWFVEGGLDFLLDFVNAVYTVVEFTGKLLGLYASGLRCMLLEGLLVGVLGG